MFDFVVVYVTVASRVEAEGIARVLLGERLVACVSIVEGVSSFFHWGGRVDSAVECLLVMKSRVGLFEVLECRVRGLHSYEVPEVVAVPIVGGSRLYLEWLDSVLKR